MAIKLQGIVEKITYYNESNGYGVVRIKLDYRNSVNSPYNKRINNEYIIITCNFSRKPIINEEYIFTGEFITNQYGLQLKATYYETIDSDTLEGVITYLSSEMFEGIGVRTATKIYETLGPDCLKQISDDKACLKKVNGITSKQIEIIYNGIISNIQSKEVTLALLNLGLSMATSLKIYNQLGFNAIDIIKENPYQLINEVDGIGFVRADSIAKKLGISNDNPLRIKELVLYQLVTYTYSSGDCYVEKDELFKYCYDLYNDLTLEIFDKAINSLSMEDRIVCDNDKAIYEKNMYKAENIIARTIHEILKFKNPLNFKKKKIERCIDALKKANNITYNDLQLKAIETALSQNISIITGGPGTGKSTIVKAIVDSYIEIYGNDFVNDEIMLLAPTGRAAKRLCELTVHSSQTIHKFLGYSGHGKYEYGYGTYHQCKMIIVDEASMIDCHLFARLITGIEVSTKIVIVGDSNQLPSVSPGNVLYDLINSNVIETVELKEVHRQAKSSTIISLANDINTGTISKDLLEKQKDRNFIILNDDSMIKCIEQTVLKAIDNGMDLINDIQVLIPMYKGSVGIDMVNSHLQNVLNTDYEHSYDHFGRFFRENDKVIQLVNRSEKEIMNGDIGYISYMDYDGEVFNYLCVQFDSREVKYLPSELSDLTHAYAMSVHKSQGSEFALVIMPFSMRYHIMLRRKLIYTGVTRAKKFLILIGNPEAYKKGIQTLDTSRKTKLMRKLKQIDNSKIDDSMSAFSDIGTNETKSPYDFIDE